MLRGGDGGVDEAGFVVVFGFAAGWSRGLFGDAGGFAGFEGGMLGGGGGGVFGWGGGWAGRSGLLVGGEGKGSL